MRECFQKRACTLSRRKVLSGAAALFAASAITSVEGRGAHAQQSNAIAPSEALDRLMQGNARYAANEATAKDFSPSAAAQSETRGPIGVILGCADDPVPPEILFDQEPGALFVVRNAGNVVTDTVLASLEYAVQYQNVSLIIVLGHSNCRAIGMAFQAVRERKELEGHLPELVKAIEPAVLAAHAKHPRDFLGVTIEENVRLAGKNLIKAEPILSNALAAKKIAVSGGIHDIASGAIKLI